MDFKKKRCDHCQKPILIWIECPLCEKVFCIPDRTPEAHLCQKMDAYKKPVIIPTKIFTPKVEYI